LSHRTELRLILFFTPYPKRDRILWSRESIESIRSCSNVCGKSFILLLRTATHQHRHVLHHIISLLQPIKGIYRLFLACERYPYPLRKHRELPPSLLLLLLLLHTLLHTTPSKNVNYLAAFTFTGPGDPADPPKEFRRRFEDLFYHVAENHRQRLAKAWK
jgi:hypothetical protein